MRKSVERRLRVSDNLRVCCKLMGDSLRTTYQLRVSESRKCFQLERQFRDTSSEHRTPEHDTQSTHIAHHHRDSTCTTTITDDELINDDGERMEKVRARRRQSNPCKIWKQNASNDRRGTETINERELRKIRGL